VHLAVPAVAGFTMFGILSGVLRRVGRRLFAASRRPRGA